MKSQIKENYLIRYNSNPQNALTSLRLKLDLTQQELAKKLNVCPQAVSKWELKHQSISEDNRKAYAKVLGVSEQTIIDIFSQKELKTMVDKRLAIEGVELQKLVAKWFCDAAGRVNGTVTTNVEAITADLLSKDYPVRSTSVKQVIGILRDSKKITITRDGINTNTNTTFKVLQLGWKFAYPEKKELKTEEEKEISEEIQTPILEDVKTETLQEEIPFLETEFEDKFIQFFEKAKSGYTALKKLEQITREYEEFKQKYEILQFENLLASETLKELQEKSHFTEEESQGLAQASNILNHIKLIAEINGTEFDMFKVIIKELIPKGEETQIITNAATILEKVLNQSENS